MSHNIKYFTYNENCNKKQVQRELDDFVADEDWQEGASGLICPIRWLENVGVCDNYTKAKQFIQASDRHNYDCLAVRYKEGNKDVEDKDKKLKELTEKCEKVYQAQVQLEQAYHFYNVKSETIGCKKCGSKIASKYMRTRNNCPVCYADMRPQTTLDRIKALEEKSSECEKQMIARMDELAKKSSKVKWLVKIEYHT